MRGARISIAVIILTSFFLLALRESRYATPAFGQAVPAAGPSAPVVTLPAAPGQPQAFSTIGALPQLLPAPHPQLFSSPTPTPSLQAFRCSCGGPGVATSWIGQVSAANLLLAQQQAPNSCTAYRVAANAESPRIAPPGTAISGLTQPVAAAPGTLYSAPPGSMPITILVPPAVLNHQPLSSIQRLVIANGCSKCACD